MSILKPYIIYFIVILSYILTGYVKINAQEVVCSAGDSYRYTNGSISYTIGEPVIETFSGGNNILTQGFQQSNLVVTAIDELPALDFEISAFPNPTAEFLKLRVSNQNIFGMKYMLYDMNGNLVFQSRVEGTESVIPFSNLSPAEYILIISDQNKELKSFKIIKLK